MFSNYFKTSHLSESTSWGARHSGFGFLVIPGPPRNLSRTRYCKIGYLCTKTSSTPLREVGYIAFMAIQGLKCNTAFGNCRIMDALFSEGNFVSRRKNYIFGKNTRTRALCLSCPRKSGKFLKDNQESITSHALSRGTVMPFHCPAYQSLLGGWKTVPRLI